jgi:DNA-binding beta-propeller fold protein YncE
MRFLRYSCVIALIVLSLTASTAAAAPSGAGGVFSSSLSAGAGFAAVKPASDPALPASCGSEGEGAAQLHNATAIAVDQSTGDVFVLDSENNRVDEFTGGCVFVRAWGWRVNAAEPKEELQVCTEATGCEAGTGAEPGGPGQIDRPFSPGGIAVEQSTGDVYVLDERNARVEKFTAEGSFLLAFPVTGDSVAVGGPAGMVYVGEAASVQQYNSNGEPGARIALEDPPPGGVTGLALTASGEMFVDEGEFSEPSGESRPAYHYSVTGTPVGELAECADAPGEFDCHSEGAARALTLGPSGEVFIGQRQRLSGSLEDSQVRGFTPAGVQFTAFATIGSSIQYGVAFADQTGAIYGLRHGDVAVLVPPPPGPVITEVSAAEIEPTSVVVHATVNPETRPAETLDETAYRVEYGMCASAVACESTSYEHSVPSPEGLLAPSFGEDPIGVNGAGVPLSGLAPRSRYHYRVVASDQCEKEPVVHPGTFSACVTEGENSTFETQPPALIEEVFAGDVRSTSATLHARIDPLGSPTSYQFRYGPCGTGECSSPVEPEAIGSGKPVAVEAHLEGLTAGATYHYHVLTNGPLGEETSEEHSFTTQTGGLAGLPDDRQWELVSPPDKHGAALLGTDESHFTQAAADGDAIVFNATIPTEGQPAGNGEITQVLAKRTGGGWSDRDLNPAHSSAIFTIPADGYRLFSTNLEASVLQPGGNFEPALSSAASEETAYLREGTGPFVPLVTHAPGYSNDTANPFVPFGNAEDGECINGGIQGYCGPLAEGASPDLSHIIINSGAPLVEGQTGGGLYEWSAGKPPAEQLQLVSIPPTGIEEHDPVLGGLTSAVSIVKHAVSEDGSIVFSTGFEHGNPELFVRDVPREETVEIAGGGVFEGASANGQLVFHSGRECEVLVGGAGLECKPVLEAGTNREVEDGTVLATSEDASWVYFLKEHDIYVRHGNAPAQLVAENARNIEPGEISGEPVLRPQNNPWRASPNGEWFAFMSNSTLTSYDNRDAVTGQPDEEVYLYSAASGRLVCASCNPTGARPTGAPAENLRLAVYATRWETPIAATVPAWAPYRNTFSVYDPRFLTNQGRLFFNAVEGLVPLDVNNQVDTYELEPPSIGSCTTSTHTGTSVYDPAAEGCIALLSNGESSEESVFQDASENGQDVFFLSSSKLTGQDLDGSLSLWDAQACTSEEPCPPLPAANPAPCNTEASCKANPEPEPTIYQAPPSATFNGPGNVTPAAAPPAKKVTKKVVKCKPGFVRRTVKSKKGKAKSECIRKPKPKKRQGKK